MQWSSSMILKSVSWLSEDSEMHCWRKSFLLAIIFTSIIISYRMFSVFSSMWTFPLQLSPSTTISLFNSASHSRSAVTSYGNYFVQLETTPSERPASQNQIQKRSSQQIEGFWGMHNRNIYHDHKYSLLISECITVISGFDPWKKYSYILKYNCIMIIVLLPDDSPH